MNQNLQRALLLVEQRRPELAVEHFRLALAEDPNNGHAHAMLALCLAQLGKLPEAQAEAAQAIHFDPDESFSHYVMAWVLDEQDRHAEAETAVREAIRLDPEDADNWSLLAATLAQQERWQEALEAAEHGLEYDPTHPGCMNQRAIGLQMTGRRQESIATTDAALARDPENPATHYARGLALLESGERKQALHHFAECLRLNPQFEPARDGIVEALRSANPVYRWFLRGSFWLARKGSKWGIVITLGAWVLVRIARGIAESNPPLAPFLWPLVYAYMAFVFFSWLGGPLHDLVLRLHPLGKLALTPRKRWAANLVGLLLLGALLVAGWGFAVNDTSLMLIGAAIGLLALPTAGTFACRARWAAAIMGIISGGLALFTFGGAALYVAGVEWGSLLSILGLLGSVLSTWVALALQVPQGRKRY